MTTPTIAPAYPSAQAVEMLRQVGDDVLIELHELIGEVLPGLRFALRELSHGRVGLAADHIAATMRGLEARDAALITAVGLNAAARQQN
ncbi:hypothetical protein [Rhodococcus koreensis]|uniref:hypothetical protein n=1 Tax=Rhodococcus koreensis TaxID=99653 RepID=UPI00366CA0F8